MLHNLFAPKWRHTREAVRRKAIEAITDQSQLYRIVTHHVWPGVNFEGERTTKRLAISRIIDENLLKKIATEDLWDTELNIAACDRIEREETLFELLESGILGEATGASVAKRIQDKARLEQFVCGGTKTKARIGALVGIEGDDALARVFKAAAEERSKHTGAAGADHEYRAITDTVRKHALWRIESQDMLTECLVWDAAQPSPKAYWKEEDLGSVMAKITNQANLQKIAARGDYSARMLAVRRVTDQAALAAIARGDGGEFVRKAAVERMTDQEKLCALGIEEATRAEPAKYVVESIFRALTPETVATLARAEQPGAAALLGALLNVETYADAEERKISAARALAQVGDPAALNLLRDALEKDRFFRAVREVVEEGVRARDPEGGEAFIAAVRARKKPAGLESTSIEELIRRLRTICDRWAANETSAMLDAEARGIGAELNRRGGMAEMRAAHRALGPIRGARTLDMTWNGIGDWMG